MLIVDIEANGFLEDVTKLHVLGVRNTETGEGIAFRNHNAAAALRVLMEGTDTLVMHNGIKYDVPVLKKLYPWFDVERHRLVDTLVLSRLLFPDLAEQDYRRKNFPSRLVGRHSLEAWGYRLGIYKDEYQGGFEEWNQEMEDYCLQDLAVTEALYHHLMEKEPSAASMCIEHRVAWIISRQERHGFYFHTDKAVKLYGKLSQRKHELEQQLKKRYGWVYIKKSATTYRTDQLDLPENYSALSGKERQLARKKAEVLIPAGVPVTMIKQVPFNPGSRDHIIKVLTYKHGWQPKEFTDGGKPKVDEKALKGMDFPEAPLFNEYFLVLKRIGQVAEGKEAWLNHVKADNRIHGSVITNGAVTGRMTHNKPNVAQTPAGYSPYGHECRECFGVPPDKIQVGADAAALELRDLAGYMRRYDGGAYVNTVVNGRKEDGTEMHTVNRKALEIDSRDDAKTWFYAFIYGAGDEKLGTILLKPSELKEYWHNNPSARLLYAKRAEQGRPVTKRQACYIDRGSKAREKFLANLPALGNLVKAVKDKAKAQKHLLGLDGRKLHVRSEHAALNTLLQAAGAVQMKLALIILDDSLQAQGLLPGKDYEFIANVHDEWQLEVSPEYAEVVGKSAVEAIRQAGVEFDFGCPLDGEYKIGKTWADTH